MDSNSPLKDYIRYSVNWKLAARDLRKETHVSDEVKEYTPVLTVFIEEQHYKGLTDLLSKVICKTKHPEAVVFQKLIHLIQNSGCQELLISGRDVLWKLKALYPPTSEDAHSFYMAILTNESSEQNAWMSVSEVFKNLVELEGTKGEACIIIAEFWMDVLEVDFVHFLSRDTATAMSLKSYKGRPLVARILWKPKNTGEFNRRIQEIEYCMRELLRKEEIKKLKLLQRFIAIAAQCCFLVEPLTDSGSPPFYWPSHMALYVKDTVKNDLAKLQCLLDSVSSTKFQLHLCMNLMKVLFGAHIPKEESLREIKNSYIQPPRSKKNPELPLKRDGKGETILHAACKKNDYLKLRELLREPEIDPNVADNAGWTPLHEACNHGSLECVEALLEWKQVSVAYFLKGLPFSVALDKASIDKTTPLMDAVSGNHLEIVKLLLPYVDNNMFERRDKSGKTVVDLAESVEMKNLLALPLSQQSLELLYPQCSESDSLKFLNLILRVLDAYIQVKNLSKVITNWTKHRNFEEHFSTAFDYKLTDQQKIKLHDDLLIASSWDTYFSNLETILCKSQETEMLLEKLVGMFSTMKT